MMRLLGILAVLPVAACVTPSIPIPPPDPAEMTFQITVVGQDSSAIFTYPPTAAYVGTTAYVFNRANNLLVGGLANDDGSLGPFLPLPAVAGDNVVVTIEGPKQAASTCIVLRDGQQDPTLYCP